MASGSGVTVTIDGVTPNQSSSLISTAISNQPFVNSVPAKDPTVSGVFSFSANDIAGTSTANNYVVLFNPIGSGKNVLPLSTTVSNFIVSGSIASAHSLLINRCTLVSGGSLQAGSAINKYATAYPNAVGQVYLGNPTATLGAQVVAIPPAVSPNGAAVILEHLSGPLGAGPLILAPGEGVAYSMAVGFTNLSFNIAFSWGEQ